jgi:hypothetical protein
MLLCEVYCRELCLNFSVYERNLAVTSILVVREAQQTTRSRCKGRESYLSNIHIWVVTCSGLDRDVYFHSFFSYFPPSSTREFWKGSLRYVTVVSVHILSNFSFLNHYIIWGYTDRAIDSGIKRPVQKFFNCRM